jgi:hypothetical protein
MTTPLHPFPGPPHFPPNLDSTGVGSVDSVGDTELEMGYHMLNLIHVPGGGLAVHEGHCCGHTRGLNATSLVVGT